MQERRRGALLTGPPSALGSLARLPLPLPPCPVPAWPVVWFRLSTPTRHGTQDRRVSHRSLLGVLPYHMSSDADLLRRTGQKPAAVLVNLFLVLRANRIRNINVLI